jgi:hypothetical protein
MPPAERATEHIDEFAAQRRFALCLRRGHYKGSGTVAITQSGVRQRIVGILQTRCNSTMRLPRPRISSQNRTPLLRIFALQWQDLIFAP